VLERECAEKTPADRTTIECRQNPDSVIVVQALLILRSEVVEQRQNLVGGSELQHRIARFTGRNVRGINFAVTARNVDVAAGIRCDARP